MLKQLYYISLLLLTACTIAFGKAKHKTHWEENGIHGKVKKLTILVYHPNWIYVTQSAYTKWVIEYNTIGLEIIDSIFDYHYIPDNNSNNCDVRISEYNVQNEEVKQITPNGTFEYLWRNERLQRTFVTRDSLDTPSRILLEERFYSKGNLIKKKNKGQYIVYTYDSHHNKLTECLFDKSNVLLTSDTFTYNNNILATCHHCDYEVNPSTFYHCEFDKRGCVIKSIDRVRLTSDSTSSGKYLTDTTLYTYSFDERNNETMRIKVNSSNGVKKTTYFKTVYEYDKLGNWISKTEYKNDVFDIKTTRSFEYYK